MGFGLKYACAERVFHAGSGRKKRILAGLIAASVVVPAAPCAADESVRQSPGLPSDSVIPLIGRNYAHFYGNENNAPGLARDACRYALLSASVDSPRHKVFDPVVYTFVISLDKSCQIAPMPPKHDAITCAPPTVQTIIRDPSTFQHTVRVSCQYARPGVFYTTPFQAMISDRLGSAVGQYYPGNMRIDIKAFETTFNPEHAIETTIPLRPWKTTMIQEILMGIVGAVALFAVLLTVALFMRPKTADPRPFKTHLSPIEAFHAQIAALLDIDPDGIEENKALYDRLAQAMRELIQAVFEFDAFHRTTAQITAQLRQKGVGDALCDEAGRILLETDRVKFTVLAPSHATTVILMRDMSTCGVRLDEVAVALKKDAERINLSENQENPDHTDSSANTGQDAPQSGNSDDSDCRKIAKDCPDKDDPMRFAPPGLATITPRTPPEKAFVIELSLPDNTGWTPSPHHPAGFDALSDHRDTIFDNPRADQNGGED